MFINSSKEFRKHPEVRKLNQLSPDNIDRIVDALVSFRDSEGFSRSVPVQDVLKREGNLNVTLYVSPINEEEHVDIRAVLSEMGAVDNEVKDANKKLDGYLKELGYLD